MRTLLALIFASLLLVSCSGKGAKNDVTIALTLGNVASGVPLTGGVFLAGTNGAQKFSFGTANAASVNIPLPNGNWTITALGWKSGSNPMEGINVCGQTTIDLQGGDAAVNLSLSTANCNSASYADANSFDTGLNNGTFKDITFKSCLTTAGVSIGANQTCDNTTLDLMIGQSAAVKVIMRGESNFGAPVGDLTSACVAVDSFPTDLNGSVMTTNLRLPINVGGAVPFALELQGFRSADCGASGNGDDDQDGYIFLHGLGGAAGGEAHSFVHTADPNTNFVYWPDNYLGYPDSAFRTSGIAPIINCGGQCFNGDETLFDNYPIQNVKQGVWDIVGNPSMINLNDEDKTGNAFKTFINGADTLTITVTATGQDKRIETFDPDFGSCGAVMHGTPHIITGDTIKLQFCSTTATTTIRDYINSQSATLGITASSTGVGSTTNWNNRNQDLRYPKLLNSRDFSLLGEVKHMLYGPMGAVLFENGLTNLAAVCADSGTYTESFIDEFGNPEYISISLSTGSIVPPNYMTTNNGTPFDKRLTFEEPNGGSMAFEFNCTGELKNGWFAGEWNDDGEENMEVHYATEIANQEAVEVIEYDNNSWGLRKQWKYFQKVTATNWNYYQVSNNPDQSWYSRISARGDDTADKVDVYQYENTGINAETTFTGAAGGGDTLNNNCFFISTETTTTGCTAPVEPAGSGLADGSEYFTSPILIPGLSTTDLDLLPGVLFNAL